MNENLLDDIVELQSGGHSHSILTSDLAGVFHQHPSLTGGAQKHHGGSNVRWGWMTPAWGPLCDLLHSWVYEDTSFIKWGKKFLPYFVEKRGSIHRNVLPCIDRKLKKIKTWKR